MAAHFRLGRLSLAPLDVVGAAEWILDAACRGQPCVVVTSNIHHLRLAEIDPAFSRVVSEAELNVADGWPLVAANRLLPGPRLPSRVAGIELVDTVLRSDCRLRVALLGGPPGAAEELGRRIQSRHDVVLVEPLPKGSWEDAASISALRSRLEAARPSLTLVAVGAPRQELLAEALRSHVHGPIICCGAAVEVLADLRPRAPRRLQSMGLEWAFRLALEPARLGPRYFLSGFAFLCVLGRDLIASLAGKHEPGR